MAAPETITLMDRVQFPTGPHSEPSDDISILLKMVVAGSLENTVDAHKCRHTEPS